MGGGRIYKSAEARNRQKCQKGGRGGEKQPRPKPVKAYAALRLARFPLSLRWDAVARPCWAKPLEFKGKVSANYRPLKWGAGPPSSPFYLLCIFKGGGESSPRPYSIFGIRPLVNRIFCVVTPLFYKNRWMGRRKLRTGGIPVPEVTFFLPGVTFSQNRGPETQKYLPADGSSPASNILD